jgi:hypothetical protein
LVPDKGRANCETLQGSFVFGFVLTNKLVACGSKLMEKLFVHVWTFGQKKMGYCLLLIMVLEKEEVREIVQHC